MPQLPIYLDNNAATRCDPRVVEAMLPFFTEAYGNAGSRHHAYGWKAAEAVDEARQLVADSIGADAKEIVFTSGATESNNLALKGAAVMYRRQGNHLVTVQTEHHAVLDPCRRLQREGYEVSFLPVDRFGRVTAEQVGAAITDKTILVSVMAANNEIGTLQPIAEIGRVCKVRKVLLHTDATQAVGKIPIDVEALQVDLLSLSGHKMYGPKGVGALFVRRRNPHVRLEPLLDGGGHERGLRSGTLPVPLVVGLGEACKLCGNEMPEEAKRCRALRDRLWQGLNENREGLFLNGHPEERLPGNLNVSFAQVRGEALLMALKNIAVSSGSACTSASVEPSYVLRALGVPDDLAHSSIRFGVGRFTTAEEIEFAIKEVTQTVQRLRLMSPDFQMTLNQ
ncbi:MAG: IscS subfamily cysteine desulfurase [Gemmataceae bacterium]|nr:IscS subfamily cysteine desulfurase [Gemmataceae bacterium]MCI0739938.1 IscS subfamily cysteine desulfurase [Gemmataceae bacterium]